MAARPEVIANTSSFFSIVFLLISMFSIAECISLKRRRMRSTNFADRTNLDANPNWKT